MPNHVNADARALSDAALWAGLDLAYPPLAEVKAALARADEAGARAALVRHFRTRRTPIISPYRTDAHWDDWEGGLTLLERADLLTRFEVAEAGHPTACVATDGRFDWQRGKHAHHELRRQGAMATLAEGWRRTQHPGYAAALQTWMLAYWRDLPFVLEPGFHRESFADFGGAWHRQLDSCYIVFHWADILDSALMRQPGVLPDDFCFAFIRQFWFLAFQHTRYLGSSWRADNHHLMERGVACYVLGVGYPEFKRAAEMESYGAWNVQRHFDHNVLPDNTGSEACTQYQYRCFIRYAVADAMGTCNGRSVLGPARKRRLLDWLEFNGWLTAPDGRMHESGDGAGPTLASICRESGAFYRSATLKGILHGLGGTVVVNPHFQSSWERTPARPPKPLAKIFPNGGHLVLRDAWRADANWFWLGIKNDALYNIHTHWNTFDFAMSAHGRRIIGNPISRIYGLPGSPTGKLNTPERGEYFSMDSHNTLVIDDDILTSHAALGAEASWGLQPPRISVAGTCLGADGLDYATFRHDGYRPLLHRRDVLFVHGRYVLMTDGVTMDFTGFNTVFAAEGDIRPHRYRQRLHFESGVAVSRLEGATGLVARAGDAAGLLIVPEPGKALSIDEGPSSFLDSRGNADFCGLRRADLHRRAHGPCMFSTVYRPFTGRQAPNLVVTSLSPPAGPHGDGEHHVVQIADGDHLDLWLLQRNQQRPRPLCLDVAGRRLETDAAVLYLSLVRGRLARAFRIGGSGAKLDGTAIRVRGSQLTWHKRP